MNTKLSLLPDIITVVYLNEFRHCEPCVAWQSNPQPTREPVCAAIASYLAMTGQQQFDMHLK